nr:ORF1ab [Porcine astrovirus 3]
MALPFDDTLKFGSATARMKGRRLDSVARTKLKDLLGNGPYFYDFGPLEVVDSSSKQLTVKMTSVQTVYVSSVVEDNSYVTYKFVPGVNDWVETEPVLHKPTALVGVLFREYERYKNKAESLSQELSQLKLEYSLLRHDYERIRPQQPVASRCRLGFITKLLIGLLIGSLMAHSTLAHKTPGTGLLGECLDTDVIDGKQVCVNFLPRDETEANPTDGDKTTTISWDHEGLLDLLILIAPYLVSWPMIATMVGFFYVITAEQPAYMLVSLLLATYSKAQVLALAGLPFMDMPSVVTLWVSMLVHSYDAVLSLWVALLLAAFILSAGVFMPDVRYSDLVRGQIVVFLVLVFNYLVVMMSLPSWLVFSLVVGYRVLRVLTFLVAEKVEVRGPDGKVVETRTSMPAWVNKASNFLQTRFYQKIRTGISPTARVIPNGVIIVETQDGMGTGFRCRNYLVTAGHVVTGTETPKVQWAGVTAYSKVVYRVPNKDIAFLSIPQELQELPSYRLAKKVEDGPVVITSLEDSGALSVAVTEGVIVNDSVTYAVQTRNGMSGSPVTNLDGRILGTHQTNTGFTGGAVILVDEDFPQPKKSAREQQLEARIKELEAAMNQSSNCEDIVELVRAAVAREFKVLRTELSATTFTQAKGKNKKHHRRRGGKKRRAVWSEEEYKELLEKGFSKSQLRDMAEVLRSHEEDPFGSDTESEGGFPEWSDVSDTESIEREWFGQSWEDCKPVKEEPQDTLPVHLKDKYTLDAYVISKEELKSFAKEFKDYVDKVEALIDKTVQQGKWLPSVNPTAIIEELNDLWFGLNMMMWEKGLVPFTQRKKIKRKVQKKLQGGPQEGPITYSMMDLKAWRRSLSEVERHLVPEGYPLIGGVPLDRPISDWDEPIDDLLLMLPAFKEDLNYTPAVWGPEAYAKSFDKFTYREPCPNIAATYPREWSFATKALRREYSFLEDSVLTDITATSKNADSTPAYPKSLYWKTEADYLDERGYQDYIKQLDAIYSGERPDVLWYLFLKKEILKVEKVEQSDIRQIVCSDPIFARIGCHFEEDQNVRMKNHTKTRSGQCGWSPFFGGFNDRIKRLCACDPDCYIEFDWTRFDGTIPNEVFMHIKKVRYSFFAKDFRTKRVKEAYQWYCEQLLHRHVVLPSGEVTLQTRGNPSGQISTTMDNNMVNVFLQAFEYAYLHPELTDDELETNWSRMDTLVYGDDRLSAYIGLPANYVERVVTMYSDVFGMWVKPEKVIVSLSIIGLTFCGLRITSDGTTFLPVPAETNKLISALIKPTKKLQDVMTLYGKLLCYRILGHNLPDDNKFKAYILVALEVVARHIRIRCGDEPLRFTDEMLDRLWRGGPKVGYGW